MNTTSRAVWQLIQNMTRDEKLFFKKESRKSCADEPTLYVQLFDCICRQKNYDEAEILEQLAPTITKKNIAFQKHYLHNQLNSSLIRYDNRNNTEQEVYQNIQLIRVNRKKGLLNEALALWKKTMNDARRLELFSMSQLLKKEFEKMILFSSVQVKYDELHDLFRSNTMSYDDYAEMITLRDIYAEIVMLRRKAHFDFDDNFKRQVGRLMERVKKMNKGFKSLSFWYRHYTRMCHATLHYLENNINRCLPLIRDGVSDWWEHKDFIETDAEHYIELLYMVNYAGILHGDYDYVEQVFNHPANQRIKAELQQAGFEALQYLALNKIYNKTANYSEVKKLVDNGKEKYKRWEPLLSAELNRTVCFSQGIACFVLDKYAEALQFIKRGLTYFKDGTREEQFIFANLFLLLIQYNIGNPRLFEAQYKSTYGYLYKKNKLHAFEKILLHCFYETFYLSSLKEKAAIFQYTVNELEANKRNEVQQQTLNIFNFHGWLLSRLQRISYKDYVKKKYNAGTKMAMVAVPGSI